MPVDFMPARYGSSRNMPARYGSSRNMLARCGSSRNMPARFAPGQYIPRRYTSGVPSFQAKRFATGTGQPAADLQNVINNNAVQFDLACFGKVMDSSIGYYRRFIWFLVAVACCVICVVQIVIGVKHYLQQPVSIDVTMETLTKISYPVVVFCPAKQPFYPREPKSPMFQTAAENYCVQHPEFCPDKDSVEAVQNVSFKYLNLTLDDLWNEYTISSEDLNLRDTSCFDDVCDFSDIRNFTVKTVMGNCRAVSRESAVAYQGSGTHLQVFLTNRNYHIEHLNRPTAAWFYYNKNNVLPIYDIYVKVDQLIKDRETIARVSIKEFRYKDRRSNPCWNENDATKCKNACMEKQLENILPCRLPFVDFPNLNVCDTWNETTEAVDAAVTLYLDIFDSSNCSCKKACNETIFTLITTLESYTDDNSSNIDFLFVDNVAIVISEESSYGLSSLLSDIGGNLGFFLGISILNFMEITDDLLKFGIIDKISDNIFKRKKQLKTKNAFTV